MPVSSHAIPVEAAAIPGLPVALEVRWSSLQHARFDRFNAAGGQEYADGGTAHRRVELVVAIQFLGRDRVMLESWLELPQARTSICSRRSIACAATIDGDLRHIDCRHDEQRLLALTLAGDDAVIYAQSDLLSAAGFAGGTYDPPTARTAHIARKAVSA